MLDTAVLGDLGRWFAAYTKTFHTTDEHIQAMIEVKEEHTLLVAGHCRDLAAALGLPESDCNLAEAVGLCHDVGRFRQASEYRTFRDRDSLDHGLLGVEELQREKVDGRMDAADWAALAFAVRWHNAMALPAEPDGRLVLFGQIVRDADKLDIFRVLPPPPPGPGCNPALEEELLAGALLSYETITNADERKLVMLSWLFDLYFPWTLQAVAARGYVERLLASLPSSPAVPRIRAKLAEYIAAKQGN